MQVHNYLNKPNWTTKEVMHFLNCSRSKVYKLIKDSKLIPYKIGNNLNGVNLYKAEDVKKLIKPLFKPTSQEEISKFDIKHNLNLNSHEA